MAERNIRVLLVDDDESLLTATSRVLKARGYEVQGATSPFGVSTLALQYKPDVIVLDVRMPALSGPKLSEFITRLHLEPEPQLIFYSGLDQTELERIASTVKGARCVSKAGGVNSLCAVLAERPKANLPA